MPTRLTIAMKRCCWKRSTPYTAYHGGNAGETKETACTPSMTHRCGYAWETLRVPPGPHREGAAKETYPGSLHCFLPFSHLHSCQPETE